MPDLNGAYLSLITSILPFRRMPESRVELAASYGWTPAYAGVTASSKCHSRLISYVDITTHHPPQSQKPARTNRESGRVQGDQPALKGSRNGMLSVYHIKLLQNSAYVILNRILAQTKYMANFPIRLTTTHPLQHLCLPPSQHSIVAVTHVHPLCLSNHCRFLVDASLPYFRPLPTPYFSSNSVPAMLRKPEQLKRHTTASSAGCS